jgi:hypothetical protein
MGAQSVLSPHWKGPKKDKPNKNRKLKLQHYNTSDYCHRLFGSCRAIFKHFQHLFAEMLAVDLLGGKIGPSDYHTTRSYVGISLNVMKIVG